MGWSNGAAARRRSRDIPVGNKTRITVCNEHRRRRRCAVLKMGVWPPGAGLQGQASNHLMLPRSKGAVVSDEEKGGE